MVEENRAQKPLILLITDSSYYPVFFRHHLIDYQTSVRPSSFPLEEIEKITPDYIVIDDQKLKDSILSICLKIREQKSFHHIPLLVISGNLKKPYIKQLIELGVNGVIQEPLDASDLIFQIARAEQYNKVEERLDSIAFSIIEHSSSADLRQRPLLNKNLLEPIYKTIKEKKPLSLLAVAIEFSDSHEFTERQITETIRRVINESSPLLSLGGGKYLLILDQTGLEDATFIAETLRDVIDHTMHITIAIGISSQKKPPYANIHDMIFDAKKALLEAQKKGTSIEIST